MKSLRKSLFSIALAASFLLLAMSLQVFVVHAEADSEPVAINVKTGVEYATVNEALAASAGNWETIKILKDIDLGEGYISTPKDFILDLNGHTIRSSASWSDSYDHGGVLWLNDFNKVVVQDSSTEKTGAIIATGANSDAIYAGVFSHLTINSGNFISNNDGIMCGGEVIIYGGKVDAKNSALFHYRAQENVTVNGGVFKGARTLTYNTHQNYGGSFYVNGGIFSDDIANYSGTNRKAGTMLFKIGGEGEYKDFYEVMPIAVKRISGSNENAYIDLQKAMSDAAEGDMVILQTDCESENLLMNKGVTLDLNGKTITEKGVMKLKSGTMTIKDSSASDGAAGTGKINFTAEDKDYTFDVIGNDTKIMLQSGTLDVAKSGGIRVSEGAELEMTGGKVSTGKCGVYVGTNSSTIYEGKATISGGNISGDECGIYVFNGSAAVSGDTSVVSSNGKSIGKEEGQTFEINGGRFSDVLGNEDGYTRPDGKYLCGFKEDGVSMYRLESPEAYNETTGEYFDDLDNAKDFVRGDGNVVKVLKDIDLGSEAVYMWNKMVLDLNGHTITSAINGQDEDDQPKGVLCLTNEGELTITDSSEGKTGAIINNYSEKTKAGYAVWIDENTKLTIEDGTIKSNNAGIYCGETIIMNGGQIDAGGRAIYLFPFDTAVVINDGIVKSGDDDPTFYFPYKRTGPEVAINGGYFSNTSGNNDDRISRKDDLLLLKVGGSGEYKDYYELKATVAKLVSGEDETLFGELQEAVSMASGGSEVIVLADCETDSLLVNKSITLDLNGKTVTEKGVMKTSAGTLTIKDSSASEGAEGSGRIEFTKGDGDCTFEVTGNKTKLLLEGGTLNAEKNTVIRVFENADIDMTGGTVSGGKCGIYVGGSSESGFLTFASIEGGTVSGNEYGIYLFKGWTSVDGDAAIISSGGHSVGMEEKQIFYIEGGAFSDAAGNGEGYHRPNGKYLVKGANAGHPKMFALSDVNKSVLNDAIKNAQDAEKDVEISADGKDLKPGTEYVTEAEKKALDDAIVAAQAVANKEDATQNEVYEAIGTVNEAATTFTESKKTAAVDKSALTAAIAAANTKASEQIAVSENGKDLTPGTEYVTTADKKAFEDAIAAAQTVLNDTSATQAKVGAAVTAINTAKETYEAAKKTAAVDKDALTEAIAAAKNAEKGVATSEDGKDIPDGTKYTTAAEKKALDDAIAAAQAILDDTSATQEQVNTAVTAINEAAQTYAAAKKTAGVDKSALTAAITAATKAEEGVATSEDGKDIPDGTAYTTAAEKKALDDAIAAAKAVLDDASATQGQVDTAVTAINEASQTYEAAKKTGSKDESDPTPDPEPTQDVTPTPVPAAGIMPATTVNVNNSIASAAAIRQAIQAAGGNVDTLVLGRNVKRISKRALAGTGIKTIVVESKKLKKKSVKGSLKGSIVTTVKVEVGNTKMNKKYVKKYKKIFTKKNAGKKVKVKR